jgi:hypothetical protein
MRHSWQAERGTEIDYCYLLAVVDVVCAIIEQKAVNRSFNKIIERRFRQCREKGSVRLSSTLRPGEIINNNKINLLSVSAECRMIAVIVMNLTADATGR